MWCGDDRRCRQLLEPGGSVVLVCDIVCTALTHIPPRASVYRRRTLPIIQRRPIHTGGTVQNDADGNYFGSLQRRRLWLHFPLASFFNFGDGYVFTPTGDKKKWRVGRLGTGRARGASIWRGFGMEYGTISKVWGQSPIRSPSVEPW